MDKRLYRSKKEKVIAGVCGGIGKYFNTDPTIVRLLAVILALLVYPPTGLIVYIACAIIIPYNPDEESKERDYGDDIKNEDQNMEHIKTKRRNKNILGILLIVAGAFLLLRQYFAWLDMEYIWPVLLIFAGIMIIVKGRKNETD